MEIKCYWVPGQLLPSEIELRLSQLKTDKDVGSCIKINIEFGTNCVNR